MARTLAIVVEVAIAVVVRGSFWAVVLVGSGIQME